MRSAYVAAAWPCVLGVLLAACAPAAKRPTSSPGAGATTSTATAAESDAPCPTIDYAALEEPESRPDVRTIALTRVFQREEARAQVVTVPAALDLDVIRVGPPLSRNGKGGGGMGFGWTMLQPSWVASATSPEVEAPLAAWDAAWDALGTLQRASYLLDVRARYTRSAEPLPGWGGRHCVEEAAAKAEREEQEAEATKDRAAEALRAVLEGLPSPRPGDAFVLAYLLENQLPYPYPSGGTARPIALLSKVAGDKSVDRELRARAVEQLARLHGPDSKAFVVSLEQVLALTRDRELIVETLLKLAAVAGYRGDPAKAEALHVRTLEQLGPEAEGWRVAATYSALAHARLERGA